jgi:hypothetical protein
MAAGGDSYMACAMMSSKSSAAVDSCRSWTFQA